MKHQKINIVKTNGEFSLSLLSFDIVHIKKTQEHKRSINYYWNTRTKEVICGSGTLRNRQSIPSVAHLFHYKKSTCDLSREEIQLGDSVCVLFNTTAALFIFGSIAGIDKLKKGTYFHILPHDKDFPFQRNQVIKVKHQKNNIFLLKDGKNERYEYMATKNLAYAKYQYQVDFAEIVISYINSTQLIINYASDKHKAINEKTLLECHKALFGHIYDWAGEYRNDAVVVGDKERPTMDHNDVKKSLRASLRACTKKELVKIRSKEQLVNKLTTLHAELAWIHPFQDGNGRSIRLFLQIVAATMGYEFDMEKLDGNVKNKRAYHYAVRRAIHNNKTNLIALISRAIKEL
ncbi:TPA: Fic family protein [Salmonella enterica subsp. enterica serovar Infantis]|uniref:protein adenylyltransferase n=1 Tax=Salmonella typhimurium TaxID=90371 RepID=A0A707ZQX0_SALTM|nr:Fic family protein [Salmonella enterica]ECR5919968.1 cell filamentation protein Fic [Salmonella enterica subsp. enterica serovar Virchow]HAD0281882.1 cell filamentation protein Fic [Salmonella enterica subsp. enterica serovar Typhimurium]MKN23117.1 cell filamentation protein Fic [Salmonella enterica subsp. enterica serovar Infantis]HCD0378565.1 Fic family protein [Salmonella enterica subsp. enterica serovar Infantis]HCD0382933.1 Fic family protein [Salmonella enterica subsp. enterica serova